MSTLLSEVFYKYKDNCKVFEDYTIRMEWKTSTFCVISIENKDNLIKLNIEDPESYVSVLIENKAKNEFFYALSDYSYIKGSKNIFDVLKGSFIVPLFSLLPDKGLT